MMLIEALSVIKAMCWFGKLLAKKETSLQLIAIGSMWWLLAPMAGMSSRAVMMALLVYGRRPQAQRSLV
jgi:hypothetical protein